MINRKQVIVWLCLFFGGPGFIAGVVWLAYHPAIGDVVLAALVVAACVFIWGMVCALMVSDL